MERQNSHSKTIGVWISIDSQKLNWKEFFNTCSSYGYNVVKLDVEESLEDQGHLDVFLHKIANIIAAADEGDIKAASTIKRIEQYLSNHPNIAVIDPLDNVRILFNRHRFYTILQEEASFRNNGIFTPNFAEFTTENIKTNVEKMRNGGVKFPVICKHSIAQGTESAHKMIIIFNEKGLSVCKPPCVVQSFVNHNAVLYKIYVVGDRFFICERPSVKNFYESEDLEPIFYTTDEVCKANSHSTLSKLDPHEKSDKILPNEDKIKHIIRILKRKIGLLLLGFDVVIDNVSGNHAVIDINVFPRYDNFPNFFNHLLDTINETVNRRVHGLSNCNGHGEDSSKVNGLINVVRDCDTNGVAGMNIN